MGSEDAFYARASSKPLAGQSLDFSASDSAYETKNREWFARLMAASVNTEVVYWADDNEYYDVLGVAGEPKLEAIPAPVFCVVVGLANENYFEAIRSFLGSWFRITSSTRDEWQNIN